MSGLVILAFIIIGFNILTSVLSDGKKTRIPKQKKRRQSSNNSRSQNVWQKNDGRERQSQSNKGFKENWQQAAMQEARRKLEDRRDDMSTRRKDPADKNRHRTADWGSRAGPGILNTKTVIVLLAALFIGIYVAGQIS